MQNRDDDESQALKQIYVAYILLPTYRNETYKACQPIFFSFTHSRPLDRVKKSKHFSEEGHVARQSTRKEV